MNASPKVATVTALGSNCVSFTSAMSQLVSMFVIDLLLPTHDNQQRPFPKEAFDQIRNELTDQFGGVTAFVRAPAVGLWEDAEGYVRQDEIVVFEIMVKRLDRTWWSSYRRQLEERFQQDEIIVRAVRTDRL